MKRIIVAMITLLTCVVLSDICWAGHLGNNGVNIQIWKKSTGVISVIDLNAKTITIKKKIDDKELEKTFTFDGSTKIMKDNEPKSIADLKTGDEVIVIYLRVGDSVLAKTIKIGKE